MTRIVSLQTNFSAGELDPLLRARIDLEQYANGAERLENVLVQPQGGVTRRPGLKYLFELPSAANPADGTRSVAFEFSVTDSYMLVFAHQRMYVFKDKQLITAINGGANNYLSVSAITSSILATMVWTQSADTLIITHKDINPIKIVRGATDASWTATNITFDSIPKYQFTETVSNPAATLTPSAVSGSVTFTASASVFSAGSVNQYINAEPQGRARIVSYTSGTVVNAVVEIPFFATTAIASGSWELEAGYEDVWSSSKGWPRTCSFHEGRLYFGGSKSRPSTIWGSKVGLFFDFNPDQNYDDDAVEATLDTNSLNIITDIISAKDLQIFTTGGEFYVPQLESQPITPNNLFAKAVSRNGSREGIRVKTLQSGTLYIQRQGKALNEFLFSDTTASYVSTSISLLSSHLINEPAEMSLRKATSTDEADALFILNGTGALTAYSLLRQQGVVAPSRITTDGEFKDVGVDIEDIYVVVKRTFNSVNRYFVEVFDSSFRTDCGFSGGAASGATGLPHIGESVNVIADGSVLANETVSGAGAITFDRPSTTSYEVGLPFSVNVKTLPIEPRMSVGTRIGFKKRIVEINAILYKTQDININNISVPIRTLDTINILDNAVPEFTGTKVLNGILGYTQDAQITVTQDAPLKLTLLGLEYKLSVYGGT
nr:MAG TPA: stabilization protein [Caudoviricetes sp.]